MNTNDFVQNGRISYTQNTPIEAGQDGSGTFYQQLANNMALVNRYKIDFQNQGQPLYIARNEDPSAGGETIDFRDFKSARSFKAQLVPTITGSEGNARSSFYIDLEVRSESGQTRNYKVGSPEIVRQKILSYNIKRVIVNSAGDSLIFVIEMKRAAENGYDIRYMVEALRL
jgi:predicted secreted protein